MLRCDDMGKLDDSLGFEIGEDVLYQPVEDELVLLNLKNQQYYGLDSMGSRMWHLLLEYRNVELVADRICEEYDADRSQVMRDVETMTEDFYEAGLIKIASGPGEATQSPA